MHQCLRDNAAQLSPQCAGEEGRLASFAADNFALQPSLASDCATEKDEHCADVRPGSSRIYNCLLASAEQVRTYYTYRYIGDCENYSYSD